jgi:hypothetical protein
MSRVQGRFALITGENLNKVDLTTGLRAPDGELLVALNATGCENLRPRRATITRGSKKRK